MILVGVFVAGIYVCHISKKENYDENDAILFLLLCSIGVFIGGHLLYGIVNYQYIIYLVKNIYLINSANSFITYFVTIFGGSVFYGGLLCGIAVGSLLINKNKNAASGGMFDPKGNKSTGYLPDIVTPSIPLFHFFGRIGCFLGGCCFGIESKFGLLYTRSIVEEANGIKRFPVQLLEAVFNILLFVILSNLRKKQLFRRSLLYIYLIMYAFGRFFIEYLRGDDFRGKWLFFSTSQILSIIVLGVAIIKLVSRHYSNSE
jgi:phosphatidylglycerol:prolipoprotein diacylglycerol transferase